MEILAKHISKLLFEHDCVIVPGLGGFITNYKPATIHTYHHTFSPPAKKITFNAAINTNDGILINAFAKNTGLDFSQARKIIDQMVQSIKISLLKGHKVELTDIGYLVSNKENNIQFHPLNSINYLGEAYGLTRFDFTPVNRTPQTIAGISTTVVTKTMRWAAILLPIAAVALWTTFNSGTIDRIYGNYASLIPSNNETSVVASSTPAKTLSTVITTNKKVENSVTEEVVKKQVSTDSFFIIIGAFIVPENAVKLADQLKAEGYNAKVIGQNRKKLHMVSIQSFSNKESASLKMSELHNQGFPNAWLLNKTE